MACQSTTTFVFPFNCLNDIELKLLYYDFDPNDPMYDLNSLLLTGDTQSPNDDDIITDPGSIVSLYDNCSKFITIEELSNLNLSSTSLSVLQINCRSLKKNYDQLVTLLRNFNTNPSIISMSETWLKPSDQIFFFSLSGYTLVSKPRDGPKKGGGVGFYVSSSLSFSVRDDLSCSHLDGCEYCCIEILNANSPNIIVLSLYRPPDIDMNLFNIKFPKFLQELLGNN